MQYSPELDIELDNIERILWRHEAEEGPALVVFAGIHGNELAGIYACKKISYTLSKMKDRLMGSVYMISGNRQAIKKGVRYLDRDLNRIWGELSEQPDDSRTDGATEWSEAYDIFQLVNAIIDKHQKLGQSIKFIDLHTTSAESCAFIPFNDTLENRRSAALFPVPQILGIEESIHGTLLSFINDLGYPAIGFEAGGHTDPQAEERMEAFLWLYLHFAQIINLRLEEMHRYESVLETIPEVPDQYYEITYHHFVDDARKFIMKKGYRNFDVIKEGELLAYENKEPVYAPSSGLIFMPLYQQKGNDGFFILKGRSPFWLEMSSIFRDSMVNNYLHLLPGVKRISPGSFTVDLTIARFFVKEIFHLLGYRVIRKNVHTLNCFKR
ncbi:MAG: succinylglutamate desuccinylase/aspartoacylase family protein [Balneolaceae bacterium]|nr:succinylglutamate desuccinylase/aspartoacylase family protein [Balneolaceae bacterium]